MIFCAEQFCKFLNLITENSTNNFDFFLFIISVRGDRCDYLARGPEKASYATEESNFTLLFCTQSDPFFDVEEKAPSVYRAIYLKGDSLAKRHYSVCNNGGADMAHCYSDEATGWTIRGPNSGRGEKFLSPKVRAGSAVRPTFYSVRTGSLYG